MKNLYAKFYYVVAVLVILQSCSAAHHATRRTEETNAADIRSTVRLKTNPAHRNINTKKVLPAPVVAFAETLQGVPYKYGSAKKENGFDCSGFITYVFNHFNISVPRTSAEFTNAGTDVPIVNSLPGDIILFTGSDPNSGVVGHMGLITENNAGVLHFIHASTSAGVMISGMGPYFVPRFVKVIRVF